MLIECRGDLDLDSRGLLPLCNVVGKEPDGEGSATSLTAIFQSLRGVNSAPLLSMFVVQPCGAGS